MSTQRDEMYYGTQRYSYSIQRTKSQHENLYTEVKYFFGTNVTTFFTAQ